MGNLKVTGNSNSDFVSSFSGCIERSYLVATLLVVVISFVLLGSQEKAEAKPSCDSLDFQLVKPLPPQSAKDIICDKLRDKISCRVLEGYTKFRGFQVDSNETQQVGVQRDTISAERRRKYLDPLDRSPIIKKINEYKIEARGLAGKPICQPQLLYLGEDKLFDLGPAFFSTFEFDLLGEIYTDFVVLENSHLFFKKSSSLETMIDSNYYEIVVAHEIAHGILQDLLGLEEQQKLEAGSLSRNGHSVSYVTDSSLALIEGFAEGFEAYLGEIFLKPSDLMTPHLDGIYESLDLPIELHQKYPLLGLPLAGFNMAYGLVYFTPRTFMAMDKILPDMLKASRQVPIRHNYYSLSGEMNNLGYEYNLPLADLNEIELDDMFAYAPEENYRLGSKEGVIAHLVYKMLKLGFHSELFGAIHNEKPTDLIELTYAIRNHTTTSQWSALKPSLYAILSPQGRELRSKVVSYKTRTGHSGFANIMALEEQLAEEARVWSLPAQAEYREYDLWIAFKSSATMRNMQLGHLHRINLGTATPSLFHAFLKSFPNTMRSISSDLHSQEVISNLIAIQKTHPRSYLNFISRLEEQIQLARESGNIQTAQNLNFTKIQLDQARQDHHFD